MDETLSIWALVTERKKLWVAALKQANINITLLIVKVGWPIYLHSWKTRGIYGPDLLLLLALLKVTQANPFLAFRMIFFQVEAVHARGTRTSFFCIIKPEGNSCSGWWIHHTQNLQYLDKLSAS